MQEFLIMETIGKFQIQSESKNCSYTTLRNINSNGVERIMPQCCLHIAEIMKVSLIFLENAIMTPINLFEMISSSYRHIIKRIMFQRSCYGV